MRWLSAFGAVVIMASAACTGSDGATSTVETPAPIESATPTTAAVTTTPSSNAASEGNQPEDTSNPDVVSRRTTADDVAVVEASSAPLPENYRRAAVPVDAWPAATVGDQTFAVEMPTDPIVVEHIVSVCELIAVWALPHPDFLVIGFEQHPDVECEGTRDVAVTFEIARSGLNSEGRWEYDRVPEIRELPRFGVSS